MAPSRGLGAVLQGELVSEQLWSSIECKPLTDEVALTVLSAVEMCSCDRGGQLATARRRAGETGRTSSVMMTLAELDVTLQDLILLKEANASYHGRPVLRETLLEVDRLKEHRVELSCPGWRRRLR